METLRELIATLIFIIGALLFFSIFGEFLWANFFAGITCFLIAYFIWPSKKRGHREQDNSFIDILELVIEFPVEVIMWVFRLFTRVFRSKDGSLDIDIDL